MIKMLHQYPKDMLDIAKHKQHLIDKQITNIRLRRLILIT
jgi:hypothetical protein